MKRVLTFAVVLFVAAALIGPKIVGIQLASGIENAVQAINKNPNYTASITNLQSGWFSTQAEVLVGLNIPDMSDIRGQLATNLSATLDVNAIHGPLITGNKFALAWLHSIVQTTSIELPQGLEIVNNEPVYKFEGLTGLLGTTRYTDSIAQMRYGDPQTQSVFNFTGSKGTGRISGSGLQYASSAKSISMNVQDILNFEIQDLALSVESAANINEMLTQGLYDSNMSFSTPAIIFNDIAKNSEVRISNIKLVGISEYNKQSDLGNLAMTTTIASIDTPTMALSDLNSLIEINNIQAKFLLAYQDFSNQVVNKMSDPTAIQSDMDTFINTYLLEQLQAKPEYNFSEISGKINGAQFNGSIMASIGEVDELPSSLEDTDYWVQNIIVNANMLLEKEAAEFISRLMVLRQLMSNPNFIALSESDQTQILDQQVQGALNGLVQQGMIVAKGDEVSMAFSLENGLASLNGNQIPL